MFDKTKIIKSIRMICSNIDNNNNKFWNGYLLNDNNIYTEYGRVGYAGSKEGPFPGGEKTLEKKIKEKKKKGYTEFTGIQVDQNTVKINSVENLNEVAKKQIQYSNPELEKLIERLVKSNIHNITSNTNISFDVSSGLFVTPLGVVTKDSISAARDLLSQLKGKMDNAMLSSYLSIIPHNLGMRKLSEFANNIDFDKELNILDSLESSYDLVVNSSKKESVEESIFNVKLEKLADLQKINSIIEWFENSKKKMHGYDNIKVKNIYEVSISSMDEAFSQKGEKLGNIEQVFHGTSEANLLSILKSGLKVSPPSTAFIAGKMFHNGIYGAKESSKALGYTLGRWGGSTSSFGWIFICNFAMGKTYDPVHAGAPPNGYDSVWARAKKCGLYHDELVVYKNEQVQITHLLECK
jgi:poly [ADP-ribose] polymerase